VSRVVQSVVVARPCVGYEINDHVRPHRSAFRTLDCPVRPIGVATFEPPVLTI
jgi:hypothetical protein